MVLASEIGVLIAIVVLVLIGIFTAKKPHITEKENTEFQGYLDEKDS